MAKQDALYFELLDALRESGCALCRLARRAGDRYIDVLLYEGVLDVPIRDELRDARGLCHRHAWQMVGKRGGVLGTAIIYRDVISTLVEVLDGEAAASPRWRRRRDDLNGRLAPTTGCPACRSEGDAQRRFATTLIKHMGAPDVATAFPTSTGLCLPHFQLVLSLARPGDASTLAAWQGAALRRLRDELDELIRKHDHRFAHEQLSAQEAASWQRAVAAVVGEAELGDDSAGRP